MAISLSRRSAESGTNIMGEDAELSIRRIDYGGLRVVVGSWPFTVTTIINCRGGCAMTVSFNSFDCLLWAARDEAREERTKTGTRIHS